MVGSLHIPLGWAREKRILLLLLLLLRYFWQQGTSLLPLESVSDRKWLREGRVTPTTYPKKCVNHRAQLRGKKRKSRYASCIHNIGSIFFFLFVGIVRHNWVELTMHGLCLCTLLARTSTAVCHTTRKRTNNFYSQGENGFFAPGAIFIKSS